MSWFVLSIIYVLFASIANILRKMLLRDEKSDAVGPAIIFQVMGSVIIAVFAFWHGFVFPPITKYPINFFLLASLWGLATLCLFKAYQYIEASEATIVITLEAVVTIVAAGLILHEIFTFVNIIGTAFIIFAVVYLSYTSSKITFNKGVLYAIGYAVFAGLAVVNDAFMLKHVDVLSYLTLGFLLPGLFLMAIYPKVMMRPKQLLQPVLLKKNFIFTLPFALSAVAFYHAIAYGGEASQVNTIAQASVVLTVIFAAIFLKERDHLLKKCVCAILVTIGVLLLR
jgi:drug/metabolite transporter (DMT)-like permease